MGERKAEMVRHGEANGTRIQFHLVNAFGSFLLRALWLLLLSRFRCEENRSDQPYPVWPMRLCHSTCAEFSVWLLTAVAWTMEDGRAGMAQQDFHN